VLGFDRASPFAKGRAMPPLLAANASPDELGGEELIIA
jgi:hypothetical protein